VARLRKARRAHAIRGAPSARPKATHADSECSGSMLAAIAVHRQFLGVLALRLRKVASFAGVAFPPATIADTCLRRATSFPYAAFWRIRGRAGICQTPHTALRILSSSSAAMLVAGSGRDAGFRLDSRRELPAWLDAAHCSRRSTGACNSCPMCYDCLLARWRASRLLISVARKPRSDHLIGAVAGFRRAGRDRGCFTDAWRHRRVLMIGLTQIAGGAWRLGRMAGLPTWFSGESMLRPCLCPCSVE